MLPILCYEKYQNALVLWFGNSISTATAFDADCGEFSGLPHNRLHYKNYCLKKLNF